nr:hypothetical protein [uncultured Romboutsia sp.]
MLKEIFKGNVITIGKKYKELSGEELKTLLYLKTFSNSNNYIFMDSAKMIYVMGINKRTFDKHLELLSNKGFISVQGDLKKEGFIKLETDVTFEKFNVEFVLDMLKELEPAEIKLFCTMTTYLNENRNKNYIYPSIEDIAKKYYEGDLTDEEIEKKINNKGIDKLKNKLIEKGYIKKVAAYYFEKKDGTKGISKLGYFLKTDKNEVNENEYFDFVKGEINKYNENHNNMMKLATEEYLKKCKYKNLNKYLYYRHQEDDTVKDSKHVQVVEPVVETEEVIEDVTTEENNIEEIQQDETIHEEVYEVDLYKKYTTDQTDYKFNFEMLLDSEYPYFKVKKLDEYINEFGYKVMYKVFKHDLEDIFENINGDNLRHRVNILLADKFGNFRKIIDEKINSIKKAEEDIFISKIHGDEYSPSIVTRHDTRITFKELLDKYKFLNCKKFDEILEKCNCFKNLIEHIEYVIDENDDMNSLSDKLEVYIKEQDVHYTKEGFLKPGSHTNEIYEVDTAPKQKQKVIKKRVNMMDVLLSDVDKKAVESETDEVVAEINSWFNN